MECWCFGFGRPGGKHPRLFDHNLRRILGGSETGRGI